MQRSTLVRTWTSRFVRLGTVSLALLGTTGCLPHFMFWPGNSKGYEFLITLDIDDEVWDEAVGAEGVVGYGWRQTDEEWDGWLTVPPDEAWGVGFTDPEGFPFTGGCRGSTVSVEFIGYAGPTPPEDECWGQGCVDEEFEAYDPFVGFLEAPIAVTPVITATADCSNGISGDPETVIPVDLRLTLTNE